MTMIVAPAEPPVSLGEARAWMRMGAAADDAMVDHMVRAATNICEAFIGSWLVTRTAEEAVMLADGAARLTARPVVAVDAVALLAPDGAALPIAPDAYSAAIARDGTAQVRIFDPRAGARARIRYRAGMGEAAAAIPEAIRHGILRMAQHMNAARDGEGAAPPAAVAALWQPWRRLILGGA